MTTTSGRARGRQGLVLVFTGEGKGKTTAALGTLLRAWGRGMQVLVIQFLKAETGQWGEVKAARRLGWEWYKMGDGFTWRAQNGDDSAARARAGWQLAQDKIASGRYDLVLLDEFTYPLHFGWLATEQVVAWLQAHKPPATHVLITGRYAPPALQAYADLVTEMRNIKHPFDAGIRAQPGIEF